MRLIQIWLSNLRHCKSKTATNSKTENFVEVLPDPPKTHEQRKIKDVCETELHRELERAPRPKKSMKSQEKPFLTSRSSIDVLQPKVSLHNKSTSLPIFPVTSQFQKDVLDNKPVSLTCQYCHCTIKTSTKTIHWKTLHTPGEYYFEVFSLCFVNLIPLAWPFTMHFLYKRPWLGTKHTCPNCKKCVGIHFSPNYTGYSLSADQPLVSIPYNPFVEHIGETAV